MKNIPFVIYIIWVVISPFLLINLTTKQHNTGNPALFVFAYLFITIAGLMIFYELLDLRKNESLIEFYHRRREEKKIGVEQQEERMKLLAEVKHPHFCCRCGKKVDSKLEWKIFLVNKSFIDYLLIILNNLHILSQKDQKPTILINTNICSNCLGTLSLSQRILDYSQPAIIVLSLLTGIVFGILNSAIVMFMVVGIIIGLLTNAVMGATVNWIANTDFYKIDWKYRYITFTNEKFQKEFRKLNPHFSIDT